MVDIRAVTGTVALSDISGGSISQTSANRMTYTSSAGVQVTLAGTGFQFDSAKLPAAGRITSVTVVDTDGRMTLTDASFSLKSFVTLALGKTSGGSASNPDLSSLSKAVFADNDRYFGNSDSNSFLAERGNDTLWGADGDDNLIGGAGRDLVYGGRGNDFFAGGAGQDRYFGGGGRDWLYFAEGALFADTQGPRGVSVNLALARGQIINDGFGNTETAVGIETVTGSSLNDTIKGASGDEQFYGFHGNDKLYGGGGDDTLAGGSGINSLFGGAGSDALQMAFLAKQTVAFGGSGADVFDFTVGTPNTSVSRIADFQAGLDTILLSTRSGNGLQIGDLAANQFHLGTIATRADHRVIYDRLSGNLYVDADGAGGMDATLFATLTNRAALTFADFSIG